MGVVGTERIVLATFVAQVSVRVHTPLKISKSSSALTGGCYLLVFVSTIIGLGCQPEHGSSLLSTAMEHDMIFSRYGRPLATPKNCLMTEFMDPYRSSILQTTIHYGV